MFIAGGRLLVRPSLNGGPASEAAIAADLWSFADPGDRAASSPATYKHHRRVELTAAIRTHRSLGGLA
jgi:hypothetical protein